MKSIWNLTLAIISLLFVACDNTEQMAPAQEAAMPQELRFKLNIAKPAFDGASRLEDSSWSQGDELYLRFTTSSGYANGVAVYDAENEEWVMNDVPKLDLEVTKKLELAYIDGEKTKNGNKITLTPNSALYIDDGYGSYILTMANGLAVPVINGQLVPQTGRIRFKGEPGTTVSIGGLKHVSSFDISDFTTNQSTDDIAFSIGEDGYTPYAYCTLADDKRELLVMQEIMVGTNLYVYSYTATCPDGILAVGNSGWMNMPSFSNHSGWEMNAGPAFITPEKTNIEMGNLPSSETIDINSNCNWTASTNVSWLKCTRINRNQLEIKTLENNTYNNRTGTITIQYKDIKTPIDVTQNESPNINGHGFVDLGLPSGLKWAVCNLGAALATQSGGYYAWGETASKSSYTWSNYLSSIGGTISSSSSCGTTKDPLRNYVGSNNKSIAGTQYDAATAAWGGTWRMPTMNEFLELFNNCEVEWTAQNGIYGLKLTGANGNSIFLPAAGHKDSSTLYNGTTSSSPKGEYWTSMPMYTDTYKYQALILEFNNIIADIDIYRINRCCGCSIRPVSD